METSTPGLRRAESLERENARLREELAELKAAARARAEAVLSGDPFSFMPYGGEAGAIIRSIDWLKHPLGDPVGWPVALKSALGIMLSSRHPMFIWWGPELFQFYNDAYRPSFGTGKHPMAMGQKGADCWPEIWPIIWPQISAVMTEGKPSWNVNHLVPIFRNGTIEDVYWTYGYSAILHPDGRIGGTLVVCTETTQEVLARKALEESQVSLRRSQEQLEFAVTVSKVGFYDWDIIKDEFTFSEQMIQDWGLQSGSTLQQALERVHPDDRARTIELVEKAIREKSPYRTEYRVVRPDGSLIWIEARGVVTFDADGRPTRFFGTSHDITARKKVESELAFERHKLEVIFQASPAALALRRGPEHVFEKINPKFREVFDGRELEGKALLEAIPELKGHRNVEIQDEVLRTGVPFLESEVHTRVARTDGGPIEDRYFDLSYVQVKDTEGKPYGIYSHSIEVTDRVVSRQALQENQDKLEATVRELERERDVRERFVAALSHDLRTPLTAAKMGAQLLMRKPGDPVFLHTIAARISQNMDRADLMIRDILDASRIKAGEGVPINVIDCDLVEIVRSALEELTSVHGDRFRLNSPESIHGRWDCSALQRIVENLGGNAVKYGSVEAPVTITICLEREEVVIRVHNTGPAIPEAELSTLFRPYQRAESAARSGQKGWGIGLTLVRGLAQAHGGTVGVSSTPEAGTTFWVRLPHERSH